MSTLHTFQLAISLLLIVAILLPLVKSDYWVFRVLEYPRYQKLILCVLTFASLFITGLHKNNYGVAVLIVLAISTVYLLYKISPYTLAYPKEMKSIRGNKHENEIKLYTANIYQESRSYNKVLQQILSCKPDIILLLETDDKWEKAMNVLIKDYPHCLKEPLPNTYGLLFYSRLPIISGAVKYLVEKDVPSIEAVVELQSKQRVKIFGLHPKPPVPQEDSRSTAKDKELMKVAFKAKAEKLPVIVMGDLNDVAWSYVTELFRKTSGLLDPRRGRGFYSTFSANHWFMRFPLDYVFCSSHFGLINMKRLGKNGSDHFPMLSHFEYLAVLEELHEKPQADSSELKQAKQKVSKVGG